MPNTLFDWQNECMEKWFACGCKGIINAVTGGGKTVLALRAAALLAERLGAQGKRLNVKIVVPKTFLVPQWQRAIREELGARREEIGCYFSGLKNHEARPYMIYVMNSARFSLSRHILADIRGGSDVLLIVDECHHCMGAVNGKIFDFIAQLAQDADKYHVMGLSATAGALEENPGVMAALGGVIYRYGFSDAMEQGIVSPFVLFHTGVELTPTEQDDYGEISEALILAMARLVKLHPRLESLHGYAFTASLQRLALGAGKIAELAKSVRMLAIRRKEILHLAENRIGCAAALVERLPRGGKIILFGERIETARRIYERLKTFFPGEVSLYHSEMEQSAAKSALYHYQTGETRILVSCRALDEGLNIPATDVGIVVSSTAGERQRIQRLGRILRRKSSVCPATLYYLYALDSGEASEYMKRLSETDDAAAPVAELFYDAAANRFACPQYALSASRIIARCGDPAMRRELERNLALGLIRCDRFMSEEACREQIKTAPSQSQRNYWISVLLMIRANGKNER